MEAVSYRNMSNWETNVFYASINERNKAYAKEKETEKEIRALDLKISGIEESLGNSSELKEYKRLVSDRMDLLVEYWEALVGQEDEYVDVSSVIKMMKDVVKKGMVKI